MNDFENGTVIRMAQASPRGGDLSEGQGSCLTAPSSRGSTWLNLSACIPSSQECGPQQSEARAQGELKFQKAEKRDVVDECPASWSQIIHGPAHEPAGKNQARDLGGDPLALLHSGSICEGQ